MSKKSLTADIFIFGDPTLSVTATKRLFDLLTINQLHPKSGDAALKFRRFSQVAIYLLLVESIDVPEAIDRSHAFVDKILINSFSVYKKHIILVAGSKAKAIQVHNNLPALPGEMVAVYFNSRDELLVGLRNFLPEATPVNPLLDHDVINMLKQEEELETSAVQITIDPGSAPADFIATILAELSLVYRAQGGSGISFIVEGNESMKGASHDS